MKPNIDPHDAMQDWRETRWIILRVLAILALVVLYVLLGLPL